jgi:phosphatidate cytidylyltransferase
VLFAGIGSHFGVVGETVMNLRWVAFLLVGISIIVVYMFTTRKNPAKARLMLLFGLVYISLSWGLMLNLYYDYDVHVHDTKYILGDFFFPLLIIISIWINDTMAYIVGSLIGKTPMSKISPKKTWEGTIGGIILSVVVIGLISYYVYDFERLTIHIVAIAFIAAVVGTLGDLFESKLKRLAGVKDSGSFMPGHGGFLDRFDSLLMAIPFVWVYMYLMDLF